MIRYCFFRVAFVVVAVDVLIASDGGDGEVVAVAADDY